MRQSGGRALHVTVKKRRRRMCFEPTSDETRRLWRELLALHGIDLGRLPTVSLHRAVAENVMERAGFRDREIDDAYDGMEVRVLLPVKAYCALVEQAWGLRLDAA